ncbi:MAG: hypothetical protein WCF46_03415, partial [Nitrososphaeraceae archaeon]
LPYWALIYGEFGIMSELYRDTKSLRQPYTELFVVLPPISPHINLSLSNYTRLPLTSFVVV